MSPDPLCVFLGEVSVQVLCPFFNWVVCLPGVTWCEVSIYFGNQTIICYIIGKYVFPYGWLSFHFNAVFFSGAEAILMRSHLYILSFMFLALGDISVKILLHGISAIFLSMFSYRTFMVLRLICKSFTYRELVLV